MKNCELTRKHLTYPCANSVKFPPHLEAMRKKTHIDWNWVKGSLKIVVIVTLRQFIKSSTACLEYLPCVNKMSNSCSSTLWMNLKLPNILLPGGKIKFGENSSMSAKYHWEERLLNRVSRNIAQALPATERNCSLVDSRIRCHSPQPSSIPSCAS